jgi:hypothetical protein
MRGDALSRCVFAVLAACIVVLQACGSSSSTATNSAAAGPVTVVVTSPTSGSVIAGSNVVVRGTVSPPNATVQIQGQPAAVGNGVFTGTAALHAGKTTIDVIGSAPGSSPGSTSIVVNQPSTTPAPSHTVTQTVVVAGGHTQAPASSASQTFQAPSGNITCAIQGETAQCSVASADLTFVLPAGGGQGYTTPGLAVPQGSGPVAPYGTNQTSGPVTCEIPPSSSPAGITCRNTATGHGFQASRVAERQHVY